MIRAVLLALLAAPLLAHGSCGTVECSSADLDSQPGPRITVPGEVRTSRGVPEQVPIYGRLPPGTGAAEVAITVEGPGGHTVHDVLSTRDGVFGTYHTVPGSRDAEGTYIVTVSYREVTYSSEHRTETGDGRGLGAASFAVLLHDPDAADVTVRILPGASEGCRGGCYSPAGAVLSAGGTIGWQNGDSAAHRMQAAAIGYDGDPVVPVDGHSGANSFKADVLAPGASDTVVLPRAGGILYSCLFHPWMEGTIRVTAPDVRPPPVPETITETVAEPPPGPGMLLYPGGRLYGTGEEVSVGFEHPGTVSVTLEGPGGTVDTAELTAEGRGTYSTITQPWWPGGWYSVTFESGGRSESAAFLYSAGYTCAGSQDPKDCFAGTVGGTYGNNTLGMGGSTVILSVAVPVNGTDAAGAIRDECPANSIAIFDADGSGRTGAVYCTDRTRPVNQILMDAGSARAVCPDGEFAGWDQCDYAPAPEEPVQEAVPAEPDPGLPAREPGGDCPVALLSYGTSLAEKTQRLREYRHSVDPGLLHAAHSVYYMAAPHAADLLRGNPGLQGPARLALDPVLDVLLHAGAR